ncbi:Alpha/Beta hydrolase protein [Plectosphaerella plurivora]|uniref:Alpha/Beta hydrolase protein n=1 Tax=Plectosphaerella plurivora TaxID=936078 RepID=A0A9P9A9D1_9PEZI|nr:Alpha/Beta hydrolase protein [Plectosphaerella plurivora]
MCDFTQYDGQSAAYLAIIAQDAAPPTHPDLPPIELRRLINEAGEIASAQAMKELSPLVTIQNHSFTVRDGTTLHARSYRPVVSQGIPLPVYMHSHGGGFLLGTLDKEDANCSRVAVNAGVVVFHVNYRHTPEHVFPTAWNDTEDAFEWLHAHIEGIGGLAEHVVVGGTSAGGQLATSLALRKHLGIFASRQPPIAGLVLMVPLLANPDSREVQLSQLKNRTFSSYETNKDAPALPVSLITMLVRLLQIDDAHMADLRASPGSATSQDVMGMPPTTIGVAGWDPLRDEGLLFAKLLAEAGVPTETHMFLGMPHSFRGYGDRLKESRRWDATIVNGIRWALSKPKASGIFVVKTGDEA